MLFFFFATMLDFSVANVMKSDNTESRFFPPSMESTPFSFSSLLHYPLPFPQIRNLGYNIRILAGNRSELTWFKWRDVKEDVTIVSEEVREPTRDIKAQNVATVGSHLPRWLRRLEKEILLPKWVKQTWGHWGGPADLGFSCEVSCEAAGGNREEISWFFHCSLSPSSDTSCWLKPVRGQLAKQPRWCSPQEDRKRGCNQIWGKLQNRLG